MSPRRLDEWLAWIERLHPREIELGLDRVRRVADALGIGGSLPCPVVTVAGTNGKGSSVAMLEAVYGAAGYRTATYTSPHLLRYNERVRLDGRAVDDDALCAAFERVERARGEVSLSYFEYGTLAALDLFRRASPDVAILEVGMGGRLDAVNIVDNDVALVTPIGLDHVDWLGTSRADIAREKAGIFRRGRPAVCTDRDVPATLPAAAQALDAPLYLLGRDYECRLDDERSGAWSWRGPRGGFAGLPPLALVGAFQRDNAAGVLMAIELLAGRLPVSSGAVATGLAQARVPGRYQRFPGPVPLILDVAHNEDSARVLAATLAAEPAAGATRMVFGALADKDIEAMVSALTSALAGAEVIWYVAAPSAARAADAGRIAAALAAGAASAPVHVCADVTAAYQRAWREAAPGDRIVVCGSFYTVGEVMAVLASDAKAQANPRPT